MDWLLLLQIFVSVALIALVMLQSQGTGLGSSFGGSGVSYHLARVWSDTCLRPPLD